MGSPPAAPVPADGTATGVAPPSKGLAEVVVTARKRVENIIEVPVAVTALSARDLSARGITDFTSLEDFTPGFRDEAATVNRNDRGYFTFVVRGIYPADDGPNRQAASIFLDGTPVAGGVIAGLTDVDRVEVVNGPQSAYFGRSTFSGAVNFITRAPTSTPSATIDVSGGEWNSAEIRASVEGPIIPDILSARVSARDYEFGGQYKDYGFGGDLGSRSTQSGAVDLRFTPTQTFHANAYFTIWTDHDGPSAQGLLTDATCNAGGVTPYFCGPIKSTPLNTITANHADSTVLNAISDNDPIDPNNPLHRQGLVRHAGQAVLSGEYDLPGGFVLSANGGYSYNNWQLITDVINQYPSPMAIWAYVPERLESTSGEIRLSSPQDSPFKYRVGFNYASDNLSFDTNIDINSTLVLNVAPPEDIDSHTYGIFGGASYDFTSKLTFDVELRAQIDQLNERLVTTGEAESASFFSFTPRISLRYQFERSIQGYVSYAEGTRPGQFNLNIDGLSAADQAQVRAESGAPLAVPEEHLKMAELGLKGQFFDNRLRILTDVYYGYWSDINVGHDVLYQTVADGVPTPASITVTEAGGAADLYGFEFQSSLAVTPHLTLEGTFDYAGSRVSETDNPDDSGDHRQRESDRNHPPAISDHERHLLSLL